MKKIIFIYWAQKFENSPNVVKKCLLSWKLHNPTWKIIELDDYNLNEYINIEEKIPSIKNKDITKTSYSDIVRIFLLEKYGGCWCDATTFCNKSLNTWLNKNIVNSGFFAFDRPLKKYKKLMLSSWFLYSEVNNYIIKKWKEKTIEYWNKNNKMHNYFWFHMLFDELYKTDNNFKILWDKTGKIDTEIPHFIQHNGILNPVSNKVIDHINNCKSFVYKLTYKFDINKYNNKCNLYYILSKPFVDTKGRYGIVKKELVDNPVDLIKIQRMDIVIALIYCKFYDKKIKSTFAYNLYINHKKNEKGNNLIEHENNVKNKLVSSKEGKKCWIESLNKLIDDIKNDKYYWNNNVRSVDSVTISKKSNKLVRGSHRVAICNYFNKKLYACYNEENGHIHTCKSNKYYDYIFNEFIKIKKNTEIFILYPKYNNNNNDTFIINTINNDNKMELLYKKDIILNENGFIYFLMIIYQIHNIGGFDNFNYNVIRTKLKKSYSKNKITIYFIEKNYDKKYIINFKKNVIRKYIDNERNNYGFHVTDNHNETKNISQFVLNNNNIFFANNNNIHYFTNKYPSIDIIKNTNINKKININEIINDININLNNKIYQENYCIVGSTILTLFGIRKNNDIDIITKNLYHILKNKYGDKYDNHNNYFKQYLNMEPDEIIFNPDNHFYFFNIKCITSKVYLEFKIKRYEKKKDDKDKQDIDNLKILLNI